MSEDEDKNREKCGGEREPGDIRGVLENVIEEATPTSNQQSQPQDPTPQRDRRIMRRTRAQEREVRYRIGERGEGVKRRKKPHKSHRRDVGNGGEDSRKKKNT